MDEAMTSDIGLFNGNGVGSFFIVHGLPNSQNSIGFERFFLKS